MSITGNDAGFGTIGRKCLEWPSFRRYSPTVCQNAIAAAEALFPAIRTKLRIAIEAVRDTARNARLLIPYYPQVIDVNAGLRLVVGHTTIGPRIEFLHLNNAVVGREGLTAARDLHRFIGRLNENVRQGVAMAAAAGVRDLEFTDNPVDVLRGHQLGDMTPWLNLVILRHTEETFHPTICGHLAMARAILPVLTRRVAPPAGC
jgi:hypothetical protein